MTSETITHAHKGFTVTFSNFETGLGREFSDRTRGRWFHSFCYVVTRNGRTVARVASQASSYGTRTFEQICDERETREIIENGIEYGF